MSLKKSHRTSIISGLRSGVWKARPHTVGLSQPGKKLDIVLKCDSVGTQEAVAALVANLDVSGVNVNVIHAGVGDVGKSDILMALTGDRLVVGFNVGAMPRLDHVAKEQGVEVRLHRVIYGLTEDLRRIAQSVAPGVISGEEERITGKGEVIALFKSSQKGIIVGCRVLEGILAVGKRYRIISAMGPVYSGRIESLQIDRKPAQEGKHGQEVGIKVSGFSKVQLGDLVESFETLPSRRPSPWRPSGSILRLDA